MTNRLTNGLPHIALIGKMRSGKSTVANYLIEHYHYTEYAFGSELKRYAYELFGEGEGKQRELLQWFGQTMRSRDPDIWVKKTEEKIDTHLTSFFSNIVISDCRQQNEIDMLRKKGFTIIKVESDTSCRIARMIEKEDRVTEKDLTHETETSVDDIAADFTVINNGSLEELFIQVDRIIGEE